MSTRDDFPEYQDIPEISNINCFIDSSGYFMIEADFGGADYAYLSYNFEEDEYLVEDPYIGVVVGTPDLNQAVDDFCEFYKLSSEDCQYIHDKASELAGSTPITSDTNISTDVFMLMEYSADIGPDTNGMDGDEFYCLGKFYADSLEAAKKELEAIKEKYPWLNEMGSKYTARSIYVDKYNSYFDYQPEDEDDIDMNPSAWGGAEYNVFPDLEALIEYLDFDKNPYGNYNNYPDDELPFGIDDMHEGESPFFHDAVVAGLNTIDIDPDYQDDIAAIEFDFNRPNATYDIEIFFEDGDSLKYSFNVNNIIKLDDVAEASKIVSDELYQALANAGR